ncbi:MAG: hypothetical protein IJW15_01720 [Clostridia bacterium]|nr:hypothetical protein [Clostridia bacterium]
MKRKMQRTEKKKWIERGKTAVIVFLVFCCVYFLYLLFDLYSEQISVENILWNSESLTLSEADRKSTDEILDDILAPEDIFINGGNAHQKILPEYPEYAQMVRVLGQNLHKVYFAKAEDISVAKWEDWIGALGEYGVYVKYPVSHQSDFEGELLGAKNSAFQKNIRAYRDLILTTGVVVDTGVTVFAREEETDKIVKISLGEDSFGLRDIIKKSGGKNDAGYMFAFELNLNEENTKNSSQGVSFDSMLMIPSGNVEIEGIVFDVPRRYRGGTSFTGTTEVTGGLTGLFGFNPNTIRQYANSDGALMFVGETGSLSVHPGGRIEYKSLSENEGIPLLHNGQGAANSMVLSGVFALAEKTFDICGMSDEKHEAKLKMTRLEKVVGGSTKFNFDYFVDENRVNFGDGPAMYAVVKNGVLIEFKIQIKTIEKIGDKKDCGDMFDAIDSFLKANAKVNKIFYGCAVYNYTEDKKDTFGAWEIQGGM